jgi:hypothetical protein
MLIIGHSPGADPMPSFRGAPREAQASSSAPEPLAITAASVKRKPLETDDSVSPENPTKVQLTQAAAADMQSFVRRHSFMDYLQGGDTDTTFDVSELIFPDGDIDGAPRVQIDFV